jgi:hypothetical protein
MNDPPRFLVDADLPRQTAEVIRQHGFHAEDVRDIGLGTASDAEIATHAQRNRLAIITGDFGFADIRSYPPEQYAGLVVLELPRNATAPFILGMVAAFIQQTNVVERLPSHLAVVAAHRVRMRPPV